MPKDGLQKFAEGDVYFWIEQESSIHLKAITRHGDPVELTTDEARNLAKALLRAADSVDQHH